ncbi:HIT family protein [Candidatus Woesearchaeota archaeon]|nr:HIT family protein [Candidatus Woesearchaeota archaeon]
MAQAMPQLTEEQRKQLEEKLRNMSPEELREFQKQQCIFCQIISGKVPSKKIYEDNTCLAVLDINPATKGHLLLLPKEHYTIMPQLPDKEIGHLFSVAKTLSQLLLKALKVSGTTVFIANGLAAGQRAQHFMIHLIPRKEGDGILDFQEKLVDAKMRQKVRAAIENKLNEILGVKKEVVNVPEKEPKRNIPEDKDTENNQQEKNQEQKNDQEQKKEKKGKPKKEASPEPPEEPAEEDVSLDDIASLFK